MNVWSASSKKRSTDMLDDEFQLASRTGVPVLITAEGRDQRETSARLIHTNSGRQQGPFVAFSVDGPAASETSRSRSAARTLDEGVTLRQQFDQARGGTLFIDDVANLLPNVQAQLFYLLEEYSFPQVATSSVGGLGVRVIAGAGRHLDAERALGSFCEPLFYRLNVVHIDLISGEALRSTGIHP